MTRDYGRSLWGILIFVMVAIGIDQTTNLLNPPKDPDDWSDLGEPAKPSSVAPVQKDEFDEFADFQPAMFTGIHGVYTSLPRVAPLRIETSGGADYYVKLIETATNRLAMDFYIVGGEPLEVDVPLGMYRIRYATGKKGQWRGTQKLFGKDTARSEADRDLSFNHNGHGVSGYTIKLILQSGGNLRTKRISDSVF